MAPCSDDDHKHGSTAPGMAVTWVLLVLWGVGLVWWYWTGRPRWRSEKRRYAASYLTPNLQLLFDALLEEADANRLRQERQQRGQEKGGGGLGGRGGLGGGRDEGRGNGDDDERKGRDDDDDHNYDHDHDHEKEREQGVRSLKLLGGAGSLERLQREARPCTFERTVAERVALHSDVAAGFLRFLRGQCTVKLVVARLLAMLCVICLSAPRVHLCAHDQEEEEEEEEALLGLSAPPFGFVKFPAFGWDGDSLGAVFSTFGHHVGGFVLLSVAVAGPAAALMALDSWLYATKRRVEALPDRLALRQREHAAARAHAAVARVKPRRAAAGHVLHPQSHLLSSHLKQEDIENIQKGGEEIHPCVSLLIHHRPVQQQHGLCRWHTTCEDTAEPL